jgi:hypothetical protein
MNPNFHLSTSHQQYDNVSISPSSYISQPIPYYQVPCTSSSNFSNLKEHSFFYNTPNDYKFYEINCKEVEISFELLSAILDGNNNQNHFDNIHEYYFLKVDEKKCYKVTCELISPSLIVQYLNKNIHNIEIKQDIYQQQQQEYLEFSRELKQNLEYYLKDFFIQYLL